MVPAPSNLGGAKVLMYSVLDGRQRPTGKCRHSVAGALVAGFAFLAICQYEGDDGFYLFYCDDQWNVVTDTLHFTMDQAMEQAEFEYENASGTWVIM